MEELDFLIERKNRKLGNHFDISRNKTLKMYNLTSNQSIALLFFDLHDGAMISDLKEYLKVSHQAAQKIVERMRVDNLLSISVSEVDARAKQVNLTTHGKQLCEILKNTRVSFEKQIFENLSNTEKETLSKLLGKISID